jgi:hypothetical protein
MNRILLSAFLVSWTWLSALPAVLGGETLSSDEFKQIRNLVKPGADEEKWSQIPWLSSLWEARKQAAAEGKPILLWEMDGHPLGCT